MKTNQEKNQAYDQKRKEQVRPKVPDYNFEPLQAVINKWSNK